jgi:hypothetical protein
MRRAYLSGRNHTTVFQVEPHLIEADGTSIDDNAAYAYQFGIAETIFGGELGACIGIPEATHRIEPLEHASNGIVSRESYCSNKNLRYNSPVLTNAAHGRAAARDRQRPRRPGRMPVLDPPWMAASIPVGGLHAT